MPTKISAQSGFTLIELLIVVIIIGILAALAYPSYKNYTQRTKFTEVVLASNPYRLAVEIAYQNSDSADFPDEFDAGNLGIPPDSNSSTPVDIGGYVESIQVLDAVITLTATSELDDATVIFTPTEGSNGNLVWAKTGTCSGFGYC